MPARIFRYVVRHDGGTAPRPFGSVCSLAICKPKIRASAAVGDWIIGFRSRVPGHVVYAMQVSERLPLGDYWKDSRFVDRRPGKSLFPDNIYRAGADGKLAQMPNDVHRSQEAERDISGKFVLLGSRYWYFGNASVPIPTELVHLTYSSVGHVVHKHRRLSDVEQLERWLDTWPPGRHGQPIDSKHESLPVSAKRCSSK
jgi:hypothetical protein